jgi:hypothetical protein
MMPPAALRRVCLADAAAVATLRSRQEMCFQGAFPTGGLEAGAEAETCPLHEAGLELLGALRRTLGEERRLVGAIHEWVFRQHDALAREDDQALVAVAAALERYTITLREVVREQIVLTRLLVDERISRGRLWRLSEPVRSEAELLVALDRSVRAATGAVLGHLFREQFAVADRLHQWPGVTPGAEPRPLQSA